MRKLVLAITIAAALVAAAPAFAQRASLADRVAVLEQRAANNQGNVDLLNQVTQLKGEVQALRAQIEELTQQLEQQKQTGRSQYLDLDGRLNRLEGGAGGGALSPNTPAAPVPKAAPSAAAVPERAPTVYGDAGTLAQGADERGAYDVAFNALKAGKYAESARLFATFVQQYPSGVYAPNALYWLGESYYVTQNYQLAQQQFQALLDRYPTHDKAPGALLKVGLSQFGLKQLDAAERTLSAVASRYPGTDAARTASDRLSAIQLGRLR
ncbi:tol-pal system protein YbgF [Lysobacter koreensis]|uniref:Cell division coordinator CpoB n=1 Tax=Lysobacter koreensis TaxID=266122 RepID=A0ABW2YM50_9GAMM